MYVLWRCISCNESVGMRDYPEWGKDSSKKEVAEKKAENAGGCVVSRGGCVHSSFGALAYLL